jgi:hypothetical protein
MRKPGSGLTHSATGNEPAAAQGVQRDPESIRNNLARHYSGVRTARTRGPNGSDDNGTAQQQPKGES